MPTRRARRPKPAKLAVNDELRRYVQDRLAGVVQGSDGVAVGGPDVAWIGRRRGRRRDRRWARSWSPEQISNRLRLDFPDDESMRVSHEAIYQSLFVQGRGALKRELTACPPARTRAWLARNAGVLPEGPIVDDILARGRSFAASSADCSFPSCSSVAAGVPRCTTTMSSASPGSRCTA